MQSMETSVVFRENLKRLRKERGVSQAEFAEEVNLSIRGYQLYEQGESAPTPEILDRFAEKLRCEPWDLLKPQSAAPSQPEFAAAADMFSRLVGLPLVLRQMALTLIYEDTRHLKAIPPEVQKLVASEISRLFQSPKAGQK